MNNLEVVAVLEECKRAVDARPSEMSGPSEEDQTEYLRCGDSLPDDLRTLIQEAKEMKWPFVPEKWQYKQALRPEDKTNLQDMISGNLHNLLVYLKASIMVADYTTAAAIVFLTDRFLYWVDASRTLLKVAQGLHKHCPSTPIAPQVVIRQARVSMNSGKLLKAEYILGSLISNSGKTGTWLYAEESDKILVQSVCIQIRGQILQKLGLWYEAAELICASIVGFFELPKPDKKGIASSLGILADILVSMTDEDYQRFKSSSQIDLSILTEFDHRSLSAAEACKLAAAYSPYTPLFVLTNANIRGTCLLSYSFSNDCVPEKRMGYLCEAKEAFEIGLLTKKDDDLFTSKQELHSLVKAAFCLTTVHKWCSGESDELCDVRQLCSDAVEKLYEYSNLPDKQDKGTLAKEIMSLVTSVKERLKVEIFQNSDEKSYVPDRYKDCAKKSIFHGSISFRKIIETHSKHHNSVCEVFENRCTNHNLKAEASGVAVCITALRTETRCLDTVSTEDLGSPKKDTIKVPFPQTSKSNPKKIVNKGKRVLARSDAVTEDGETGSEPSDHDQKDFGNKANQFPVGRQSSSSSSSWSNLSRSSVSWEDVGPSPKGEPSILDPKGDINNIDTQCSTAASEGDEDSIHGSDVNALVRKTESLSVQMDQRGTSDHSLFSLEEKEKENGQASVTSGSLLWGPGTAETSHIPHLSKESGGNRSSQSDSFEMIDPSAETECATDTDSDLHKFRLQQHGTGAGGSRDSKMLVSKKIPDVDPEGETVDSTDEVPYNSYVAGNKVELSKQSVQDTKIVDASPKNTIVPKTCSVSSEMAGSLEMAEVDPGADTADGWEFLGNDSGTPGNQTFAISAPIRQKSTTVGSTSSSAIERMSSLAGSFNECDSTEEGEEDNLKYILNSSHSSSSSFKSWVRSSRFSSSLSDQNSPSFLNSSGSSFVMVEGKTKEEILAARSLEDDDYQKLLSGVPHDWLIKRLEDTGVFKPNCQQKAYNALLLKYSKKSGLWTAQETVVHIGANLSVDKEGRHRNAFSIHFLHQDQTLSRYVGKAYKKEKEVLYHISDVERQMTAQYYVTEFNRRLYELGIPTQVFYLPSSVLMILEGRSLKGCVSVEPYILGEFIKLSNNTNVVRSQYKATEYGMAFGHFTYEFTNRTEIVVDLQGWVTGSEKGEALIYLTDPQIHSLKHNSVSNNFGMKGIHYFFKEQHRECNDICSQLSLTRPVYRHTHLGVHDSL